MSRSMTIRESGVAPDPSTLVWGRGGLWVAGGGMRMFELVFWSMVAGVLLLGLFAPIGGY
jgi:hypothetical protein